MVTKNSFSTLTEIDEATAQLQGLKGVDSWLGQLAEVKQRIQRQDKLVAVFGAFSAGKSSLMNAMLEENVLIVSPNPTTASVTHVQSKCTNLDVAAMVTAKTAEQLWDDVQLAMGQIHREASTLADAVALSGTLSTRDFAPNVRKYVTFLKAVYDGFGEMSEKLGTRWDISRAELRRFTAEERFACFVDKVELAHSAPMLASGTILVDTPGVDSIHRRHTDVAFRYMRNADAIIFVLYYTHAFSRADRDFLEQLADVQDVLQTNKLFVVINAIDLAVSEEERVAVRDRVEHEMKRLGIREPRIYEVSSQLSFAASELDRDPSDARFESFLRQRLDLEGGEPLPPLQTIREISGVPLLQNDLNTFLDEQAEQLAASSAKRSLQAVATQVINATAHKVEQSSADQSLRQEWTRTRAELAKQLRDQSGPVAQALSQQQRLLDAEWDELVFHMGERIRLKYASLFREAYHPGRFRGGQERLQLQEAATELSEMLSRQVDAECRTFTLRTVHQAQAALERWVAVLNGQLQEAHMGGALSELDMGDDAQDNPLPRHSQVNSDVFRPFFRYFSSPKQFFEGGGQHIMLTASESVVLTGIRAQVQEITSLVRMSTWKIVQEQVESLCERVITELAEASSDEGHGEPSDLASWQGAAEWFASKR